MNTLIATVGLPRSGKSTWVQALRERYNYPVVSTDAIRLAIHGQRYLASAEPHVWAVAKTMVPALFIVGHSIIIVDVTNTTVDQRNQWKSPDWETRFRVFETPVAVCKQRARDTGQEDLLVVIDRMYGNWEPLRFDELEY